MSGPKFDLTLTHHSGERIAAVLPVLDEDAAPLVREGIARRRIAAVTGVCPCGGQLVLPNRAVRRRARRDGRPIHAEVRHELDCAAIDDAVAASLRGRDGSGGRA